MLKDSVHLHQRFGLQIDDPGAYHNLNQTINLDSVTIAQNKFVLSGICYSHFFYGQKICVLFVYLVNIGYGIKIIKYRKWLFYVKASFNLLLFLKRYEKQTHLIVGIDIFNFEKSGKLEDNIFQQDMEILKKLSIVIFLSKLIQI